MKVLMFPHATQIPATSGVGQVVHNYFRYLPQFGIELVDPKATSYDIRVSHAGSITDAEVAHNHGCYWTADYAASNAEYATNANVILALQNAKEITVPSSWVAENITRDMRFFPHIVPHGINWKEWQHNKPDDEYVIGYNKNRKGVDICNPSCADELARRSPDIDFINTFANTPLDNIALTGVVPHSQMKSIIQGCSVYVSTIKETGGIGILEAMASGKPILGFAEGAILDLIEHGVHGYLAQPGNMEDLNLGLHFCLEHRKILGQNARERACAFTWESVAEQVAGIYHKSTIIEPATCSIIIPTFNYADKVGGAITSAMQQDYPLLQHIVVVDDGSTDNDATAKVVAELAAQDSRISYIRQTNAGVAASRNTGIASVATKYVTCLDADDEIQHSFLSTLVPALEADPLLGMAYSSILIVSPGARRAPKSQWPGKDYNYDQQVLGKNQVPTCCVFRRKMWERLGGYRSRYCPAGAGAEDAEFWLRCGSIGFGGKKVTDDPLFIYAYGSGATTSSRYVEPNWLAWHPWAYDSTKHPFASLATPANSKPSHAVRQYDQPAISVIIPVGPSHEHLLVDALDSLEAQTYHNWEAIVINDTGSPLSLTGYPYVRLINTPGKRGPGYARNRGIEVARASIFLCLDADDFLQSTALAELMAAHVLHPSLWIYTDMYLWKIGGIMEEYHTEDWDVHTLWRKGVAPVTCLYLKSHWKAVGGYDETAGREDWDYHLRLANAGYCGIRLPRLLFTYRHDTGTRRNEDNIRSESARLKKIYSEEKLHEMCKGCGKKRVDLPKPTNYTIKEESDVTTGQWPLLEYIGIATSDMRFNGKTGRKYTFAANNYHRYSRIHPDDAPQLLRFPYFRQIQNVPTQAGSDKTLVASPAPVEAKIVEQIVPEPTPVPTPIPVTAPKPDMIEVVVPDIPIPDFDAVGHDYQTASPAELVDMAELTVSKIMSRDWTPDEIRSIYRQELASPTPRVTIERWAEKEIEKLTSDFT